MLYKACLGDEVQRVKKKVKILVIAFIAMLIVLTASPLLAINYPNIGPTIEGVDVYRHCLEDDDMLVVVQYNLNYTTNPEETIAQAWLGRFKSAGALEIARVVPYSYYDSGYNHGIFSMYLSATDAVGYWDTACTAWFDGNPTLTWQALYATHAVTGYIFDDGGVLTDQTVNANSAAAGDVNLLPAAAIALDDASYVGGAQPFSKVTYNISTPGDWTGVLTFQYWNGTIWIPLSNVVDGTNNFEAAAGNRDVTFTVPNNWEPCIVDTVNAYWIRAVVTTYTARVASPIATQIWTNETVTPPSTNTPTIAWRATTTQAATELLLTTNMRNVARNLSDYWSYPLLVDTASGSKLSSYGEDYFTAAIPNLRIMAPDLFSGSIEAPGFEHEPFIGTATSSLLGAMAVDGGVFTNETIAANNDTVDDMTLLPLLPVNNDAYYVGDDETFDMITLNIGQAGVGTWTIVWEYWNGVAWAALTVEVDLVLDFMAAVGNRSLQFTRPYDWRESTEGGVEAYWIRGRLTAYVGPLGAQPLGTQCWTNVPKAEQDALLSFWEGTSVETAFVGLATWTTIPVSIVKTVLWFIPTLLIAYFISKSAGDVRPALFSVLLMLPVGNLIGMLSLSFTMVSALLCVIALGYALFYQKSAG